MHWFTFVTLANSYHLQPQRFWFIFKSFYLLLKLQNIFHIFVMTLSDIFILWSRKSWFFSLARIKICWNLSYCQKHFGPFAIVVSNRRLALRIPWRAFLKIEPPDPVLRRLGMQSKCLLFKKLLFLWDLEQKINTIKPCLVNVMDLVLDLVNLKF